MDSNLAIILRSYRTHEGLDRVHLGREIGITTTTVVCIEDGIVQDLSNEVRSKISNWVFKAVSEARIE